MENGAYLINTGQTEGRHCLEADILQGYLSRHTPHSPSQRMSTLPISCVLTCAVQAQGLWGDLLHVSTGPLQGLAGSPLNPQQLSMLIHAVATADPWSEVKPSRHWYNTFMAATQASMMQQQQQQPGSRHSSSSSSSSRSSPGGVKLNPGPAQPSGFTPQGFANMVWALGKLQRRPGSEWAAVLFEASEPQLPGFSPQGLANLGLGLANMNMNGGLPRPGRAWMDAFVAAAVAQLPGFTSQGLANLLW
jgi:hypothetical protein